MSQQEHKYYKLSSILGRVKEIFDGKIHGKFFWLKVEIASINFHNSGHSYLELAEIRNGNTIAKCKASIWKRNLESINQDLGNEFKNVLKKGNEILCFVEMQFTVKYGLAIHIKKIDLDFNLGALEKKKQETINRLKKEELLDKNKKHILPPVIQKIAIIGSSQTSGFQDILKQLNENLYKYCYDVEVFSALVQGEKAEEEILNKLSKLNNSRFEVVALVRGGGSKLDLEVFNSFKIAKAIALHDKPIFTGIGHETDISVADVVANIYHKTPTALGSYIVQRTRDFEIKFQSSYNYILEYKDKYLENLKSKLALDVQNLMSTSISKSRLKRGELHQQLNRIIVTTTTYLSEERSRISMSIEAVQSKSRNLIENSQRNLLQTLEIIKLDTSSMINVGIEGYRNKINLIITIAQNLLKENETYFRNTLEMVDVYKPDGVLKKGYAIPRIKGKLLKDQELTYGDEIEIELYKTILTVGLQKIKKKWKKNSIMKLLQQN